jgi:hypothetical protein
MADYHSPTVVQTTIPNSDMTPLERLLLSRIFDTEPDGDGLYFFSETGPCNTFELAVADLRAALTQSTGVASTADDHFAMRVANIGDYETHIEVDLSGMFSGTGQDSARGQAWKLILQDIVRRSTTLDHVTVVSAFTCTKMCPNGFGGMATLITADAIKSKPTSDILADFLAETAADPAPARSHVLLRLDESSVRAEIADIIETDGTVTALTVDAVTDADIHAACCAVVEQTDLSEERGAAVFRTALAAIREAERRRTAST